ncbi:MAG: TetR family transcriptional regulator C-terminal domain-containing protein [Actinomycetes bacterium]
MTLAAKAPEERRRRILSAAVEVLRDRGFAGTRVADIAAAAGTSPALVLYHFSSLNDVLLAALTSSDEEFYADLGSTPSDPRDRLARMGALAADGGPAFGDWQLYLEVWVRARHDERIDAVRLELDARWRQEIAETVEAGVEAGVFDSPSPVDTAVRLSSMMDGLAVQVVLGDPGMTPERMVHLWLVGAARELRADPDDLVARAKSL